MRIYAEPLEAVREVERDLFEMGINVHPQTMQNKVVADDPDYMTKELQAYGFQIQGWRYNVRTAEELVQYIVKDPQRSHQISTYIEAEFMDRMGVAANPGDAWKARSTLWTEFMQNGKFAYTYSERMAPQFTRIMRELIEKPDTRQAIINIHSYICPIQDASNLNTQCGIELAIDSGPNNYSIDQSVTSSIDMENMGGGGRIPCSMYYQLLRRNGKLDLIYTMRSCDFLVHFPVDLLLALRLQSYVADQLGIGVGMFTYFTGSLHAYAKNMKERGIF